MDTNNTVTVHSISPAMEGRLAAATVSLAAPENKLLRTLWENEHLINDDSQTIFTQAVSFGSAG